MTDAEFNEHWNSLGMSDHLLFLGDNINTIIMKNGCSYHIQNVNDIFAVVEQELYQKLTGRE